MEALMVDRVLKYCLKNRKVTIHMLDSESHLSTFAIPEPHSDEYIQKMQRMLDHAEVFQIGCGRPMSREAFNETLKRCETFVRSRCDQTCAKACPQSLRARTALSVQEIGAKG
jgi:hypothetical protein